jgi:hypothetical protein
MCLKRCKFILLPLLFLLVGKFSFGGDEKALYNNAVNYLQDGQAEVALLKFYRIVADYPQTKYGEEAQFKIIEYFYGNHQTVPSEREIHNYYQLFPNGQNLTKVREMDKENRLQTLKNDANNAYSNKKWSSCVSSYASVLEIDPSDSASQAKLNACKQALNNETTKPIILTVAKSRAETLREVALRLDKSEEQLQKEYEEFWKN